jgi:hypothetical protein
MMKHQVSFLAIFLIIFSLEAVCYPMDIQELKSTGEKYSVTKSHGIYELQTGIRRLNSIAYGYFIREQGHIRGVYYNSKSNLKYNLFVVMPADEGLLINFLKWVTENGGER